MLVRTFFVLMAALPFFCSLAIKTICASEQGAFNDSASIKLAYSDSVYSNVGRLYECEADVAPGLMPKNSHGSVTYWREGLCFSAAHCFHSNDKKYKVSFELANGMVDFYDVEKFIIHHTYNLDTYSDLAILRLKGPVNGLKELSLDFEFDAYDKGLTDELKELVYIGYGTSYDGLDYMKKSNDGCRRACRTRVFQILDFVSNTFSPHILMSQPYKLCVYEVFDEKGEFKKYRCSIRDLFEDEIFLQHGMSGGMTYHKKFGLIGISVMGTEMFMSPINKYLIKIIPYFDCALGVGRMFCVIPHLKRHPNFYTGRVNLSIRLSEYSEWIKESKDQLLNGDLVDLKQGGGILSKENNLPRNNTPGDEHVFWQSIFYNIQRGDVVTICVVGYMCLWVIRDIYTMFYYLT